LTGSKDEMYRHRGIAVQDKIRSMDASDVDGRRATELSGPRSKEIKASKVREVAMNVVAARRSVEPTVPDVMRRNYYNPIRSRPHVSIALGRGGAIA
jgi:hypothetical protein